MKLPQFLHFYQEIHGHSIAPDEADEEALREGCLIDHSGDEVPARRYISSKTSSRRVATSSRLTKQFELDELPDDADTLPSDPLIGE